MLMIIAGLLVFAVFALGMFVLVMTFVGAHQQRKEAEAARAQAPTEAKPVKQSGAVLRQVADAEIELEIRQGRVMNAIRLYQEKTGANARDARDAVEAWRDRLQAS